MYSPNFSGSIFVLITKYPVIDADMRSCHQSHDGHAQGHDVRQQLPRAPRHISLTGDGQEEEYQECKFHRFSPIMLSHPYQLNVEDECGTAGDAGLRELAVAHLCRDV